MGEEEANREPAGTVGRITSDSEDVLRNRHRRYALYCLYARSKRMRLPEIADQITEWIYRVPPEERLDERLRIYMSLYHDHVPALEDCGFVKYCQSEDRVEATDRLTELESQLERLIRSELDGVRDL